MILGVVANPIPSKGFDGKIFIDRVSETEAYTQMTHNQNFTDDASANGLIKNGDWEQLVVPGMKLDELKDAVAANFLLEDEIKDRLAIRFYPNGKEKNPKYYFKDDEPIPNPDMLELDEHTLMVRYKAGDTREKDVTCESKYMTRTMPRVGEAIRAKYHWVPMTTPIYMYLDNAGGHGKKEVVAAYVAKLRDEYNVICIHQRPRSPCTNMLDLGVWMAFQNVVEKLHFRKRVEANALHRTVQKAWEDLEPIKLTNVYKRWEMVLDLIIDDDGGNALVETKRGKLFRAPTAAPENLADDAETPAEAAASGGDDEQQDTDDSELDAEDHVIE